MHEEDYGISWKHTDFRTEEVEVRRSRRLVISMICTVGNYEYGFFWYFYNDGTDRGRGQALRRAHHRAVPDGSSRGWGKLVAPGIYGPNHQHFFNFRLDMSVDGAGNTVYEVDSVPVPAGADNPTATRGYAGDAAGPREPRRAADRPVPGAATGR